ncbi:Accelerated cell death 11 [Nymphaea thermarum]|nr:Accelerated cell death 11 [Nymphaea thermarum]
MGGEEKPLRQIAEAFKGLSTIIESQNLDVDVAAFSRACSLVSVLFGLLGFAFKFAEMDYVAKVDDLQKASNSIDTLKSMLDQDVEQNTVTKPGSHSRNLLRVKRGLDMVRVLFEQILVAEGNSLRDAASVAYAKVFAPYHGWAIRKAVAAGMYTLPTRSQLLMKLNEREDSARIQMQSYVTSSAAVINYVDGLFLSREIGIDW